VGWLRVAFAIVMSMVVFALIVFLVAELMK